MVLTEPEPCLLLLRAQPPRLRLQLGRRPRRQLVRRPPQLDLRSLLQLDHPPRAQQPRPQPPKPPSQLSGCCPPTLPRNRVFIVSLVRRPARQLTLEMEPKEEVQRVRCSPSPNPAHGRILPSPWKSAT